MRITQGKKVDGLYLEWLNLRVHIFESCYLKGFNGILSGITLNTDDVLNRGMHEYDGAEIQRKLDGAAKRMEGNLDKLKQHYSTIPFEEFEHDPCAELLSVIHDLSLANKKNISDIIYANQKRPKYAFFDKGIGVCIDSLLRCVSLDDDEVGMLSQIRETLPAMALGSIMARGNDEDRIELGRELIHSSKSIEEIVRIILSDRACDRGFAPLSVTRFLLDDYEYWIGQLIGGTGEEAYRNVNMLTSGIRQVGYLYKSKFQFALRNLQKIEGYENFEVRVKDFEGKEYASRDVYKL